MLTEHLPPGLSPRGLSKHAAAAYVGCATVRAFDEHVRKGTFPGPMPGTSRYDRFALDDAMDKLSGRARRTGAPVSKEAEADELLAAWEAQQ